MQPRQISYAILALASLAACSGGGGGGTGGGGTGGLDLVNSDVAFSNDSGTITLTTDDETVALTEDTAFDRGSFTGASDLNAEGEGQILSFSEGDATFGAFLLTRDSGASAEVIFGRTEASDSLPSGTATLTGTYVGAIIEDPDITRSFIQGEASLAVDLDDLTISGSVTNLTSELFGSGVQEELDQDIILPEATIAANGTFNASADTIITDPEGGPDTTVNTNWTGLLGGGTLADLEGVGQIDTTRTVGSATETQTGAFVVNNN